jgi:hypothetical protein
MCDSTLTSEYEESNSDPQHSEICIAIHCEFSPMLGSGPVLYLRFFYKGVTTEESPSGAVLLLSALNDMPV